MQQATLLLEIKGRVGEKKIIILKNFANAMHA